MVSVEDSEFSVCRVSVYTSQQDETKRVGSTDPMH